MGYGPEVRRKQDLTVTSPCVETLLHVDETGAILPWLATDVTGDAAANTVTISLRKGVKFHDGTDFNAEAVKWNIEASMAIDRSEVRNVESIDVLDDYTVRLNLTQYDNSIIYALGSYIGFMTSPTYFETHGGAEGTLNHPVGTGPFKFVSFERDVNLKFERFDGYWQEGKPYLDGVEFIFITDPMVRMASFQAGEGDVLIQLEPNEAESLKAAGDFVFTSCIGDMLGLAGDSGHPDSPFADIRVRQALAYAIDPKPVVETIGRGYWSYSNQTCSAGTWGYSTEPPAYSYNPQKARELLAEAGYADGLKTPLIVRNTPAVWVDFYTVFQSQLNEAGFDVTLDITDEAKVHDIVMGVGWENGIFGVHYADDADCSRSLNLMFNSRGFVYKCIAHPEEIDEVIWQITASDDFEVKKALTQEANALIRDKYCTLVFVANSPMLAARYPYVHDDGFYDSQMWQSDIQDTWLEK
jgi:peptide/nickel transport system substrate-binding protein